MAIEDGSDNGSKVTIDESSHERLPVWKTVALGRHRNTDDLRRSMNGAGCKLGKWANDMLGRFTATSGKIEVELARASVADLGFKEGACYQDICARALKLGLALCPAEVGPELRLQYRDQPRGERLFIAMEPIVDRRGGHGIFSVGCDRGNLWLYGSFGRSDFFWTANSRFVFRFR